MVSIVIFGGITGRLRAYGLTTNCYNLGTITNTSQGLNTGGIVGENNSFDGSTNVSSRTSTVSYSYNSGNITSEGTIVGGICGANARYCYVKNCYISSTVAVKYDTTSATSNVGSSDNYLGKIIGRDDSNSSTYVSDIDILSTMPTVYYVVNGLNSGESQYWSSSNINEPKLLWEK